MDVDWAVSLSEGSKGPLKDVRSFYRALKSVFKASNGFERILGLLRPLDPFQGLKKPFPSLAQARISNLHPAKVHTQGENAFFSLLPLQLN